jgi:hypothetical protein
MLFEEFTLAVFEVRRHRYGIAQLSDQLIVLSPTGLQPVDPLFQRH